MTEQPQITLEEALKLVDFEFVDGAWRVKRVAGGFIDMRNLMTEQPMTDQHLITPPPELVRKWIDEATSQTYAERWIFIVEQAAQWGYDQRGEVNEAKLQKARDEELEACYGWLVLNCYGEAASRLRDARRQKPPSLKEQALEEVGAFEGMGTCNIDIIRRALEALPDD
jgi:hypothetical protein